MAISYIMQGRAVCADFDGAYFSIRQHTWETTSWLQVWGGYFLGKMGYHYKYGEVGRQYEYTRHLKSFPGEAFSMG